MPASDEKNPAPFRSGLVSIVGRPNAGKSTLINSLVGEKVSIVTAVPQTTRNRILGVVNRPNAQIVFVDTPGIHKPLSRLNNQMMKFVRAALEERDLVLLIVDAKEKFGKGDEFALAMLRQYSPRTILLLNKIDHLAKPNLLPLMDRYSKLYSFEEILPVSALTGEGLEELLNLIIPRLPQGPPLFPPEIYTDQPERFLASEIIREKVIQQTRKELPYVAAVLIDEFKESPTLTHIHSTIMLEKESQKPIIIGAGGRKIKEIGMAARVELERLFPPKVFLELYVKVKPHWRDDRAIVAELDYRHES